MKSPVGLVTAALAVATLLAATFLIATGTRGQAPAFGSSAGELEVRTVARGLVNPWALAFLPDGTMLVTERPGRMRIVTSEGQVSSPLKGVPEVWASGQGGLLDVAADKAFAQNRTIYFCFAERSDGGGRTAVARAELDSGNDRLDAVRIIFRQQGPLSSGNHYGCRIAQAEDGNLFVTLGEHFAARDYAQGLDNHLGKVIRIAPDGSVPAGQPVRRPRRRQARDLELRPSQSPVAGDPSGHRRPLGNRARPARRRRGQFDRQRQELRLAGDRLRHRLFRRENPRCHGQGRHGAAAEILGAVDRAVGHGLLSPENCFRNGTAACSPARCAARCWCG